MNTAHEAAEDEGEIEVVFTLPASDGACVSVAAANGVVELTKVTRDGRCQRIYLDVPTLYAVMDRLESEWYRVQDEEAAR